ncbi:MAG: hypothetical protein AAGJ83_11980, partial [Planctomycetota bacterium]
MDEQQPITGDSTILEDLRSNKMGRSIRSILFLTFGLLGMLFSLAGIVLARRVTSQLTRVTIRTSARVDQAFDAASLAVMNAKRRVESTKLSIETVRSSLRNWDEESADGRQNMTEVVTQGVLRVEAGLHQAERFVEGLDVSLQLIDQAVELGNSFGFSLDTVGVERLRAEIGSLQSKLDELSPTLEAARVVAANLKDSETEKQAMASLGDSFEGMVAMISPISNRAKAIDTKIAECKATIGN